VPEELEAFCYKTATIKDIIIIVISRDPRKEPQGLASGKVLWVEVGVGKTGKYGKRQIWRQGGKLCLSISQAPVQPA